MDDCKSLSHTRWECKHHVALMPKYRKKKPCEEVRRDLGMELRRLAEQKESRIVEGHMMRDHVHMLIEMPPKHSVAQEVGYMKGKSAPCVARTYGERQRYYTGRHMWGAWMFRLDGGS